MVVGAWIGCHNYFCISLGMLNPNPNNKSRDLSISISSDLLPTKDERKNASCVAIYLTNLDLGFCYSSTRRTKP